MDTIGNCYRYINNANNIISKFYMGGGNILLKKMDIRVYIIRCRLQYIFYKRKGMYYESEQKRLVVAKKLLPVALAIALTVSGTGIPTYAQVAVVRANNKVQTMKKFCFTY